GEALLLDPEPLTGADPDIGDPGRHVADVDDEMSGIELLVLLLHVPDSFAVPGGSPHADGAPGRLPMDRDAVAVCRCANQVYAFRTDVQEPIGFFRRFCRESEIYREGRMCSSSRATHCWGSLAYIRAPALRA